MELYKKRNYVLRYGEKGCMSYGRNGYLRELAPQAGDHLLDEQTAQGNATETLEGGRDGVEHSDATLSSECVRRDGVHADGETAISGIGKTAISGIGKTAMITPTAATTAAEVRRLLWQHLIQVRGDARQECGLDEDERLCAHPRVDEGKHPAMRTEAAPEVPPASHWVHALVRNESL